MNPKEREQALCALYSKYKDEPLKALEEFFEISSHDWLLNYRHEGECLDPHIYTWVEFEALNDPRIYGSFKVISKSSLVGRKFEIRWHWDGGLPNMLLPVIRFTDVWFLPREMKYVQREAA
jgi:hypothetical protein